MVLSEIIFPEPPQDGTEDYPQSDRTFQVPRVRKGALGRGRGPSDDRLGDPSSQEWPPDLLGLRAGRPAYDRLPERRFEYVPLWGMAVFFVYATWQVGCSKCGGKVEQVPWGDGKKQLTIRYR